MTLCVLTVCNQGYGMFTLEEQRYSPSGFLYTRGPGAYKIPAFTDIPVEFNVSLLKGSSNPRAVYSSKVQCAFTLKQTMLIVETYKCRSVEVLLYSSFWYPFVRPVLYTGHWRTATLPRLVRLLRHQASRHSC